MVQYAQVNQCSNINGFKDKSHRIISLDTEKAFDKTQQAFMIKVPVRIQLEGTYLNIIKAMYDKPTINIFLSVEKRERIPLKSQ